MQSPINPISPAINTAAAALTTAQHSGSLGLAVTHLNASTGPVLTTEQLAASLRAGSAAALAASPAASALVRYLFVEVEPRLIAACARQAGAGLQLANQLYEENLRHAMPRVRAWEQAVAHLL